jgi:UDP-N-acetylglucosamine 2-epimerase (non-hydrolysing)
MLSTSTSKVTNRTSESSRNRSKPTVMLVFGTRPEAVKMAPIVRAFQRASWCRVVVVVTAQHREMLDQVLQLFSITPDHDLAVLKPGQHLSDITRRVIEGLDPLLDREDPSVVIVQGDTTTTMAAALAAFHRKIPVVHVEAGLRTFDRYSPFPEEMNRRLTSCLASLHLAATHNAAQNLRDETIDPAAIVVTGNSVIDALQWVTASPVDIATSELAGVLARVPATSRILLVTAHRRESWGEPMAAIGRALARLAQNNPNLHIIFPIHRNPVVRKSIVPAVAALSNVSVIEPLDYGAFCAAMGASRVILTDSGGVQEEAPSLGVPVLVLRDSTERQEALEAGTAKLVGTDESTIVREVQRLLDDDAAWEEMSRAVNPYGDGEAANRTVAAVACFLGVGARMEEFAPARELAFSSGR